MSNFYPRSPCGERLSANNHVRIRKGFLSTLSLRRATGLYLVTEKDIPISIHALLAESDIYCSMIHTNVLYFYPRSPCGERRTNLDKFHKDLTFLSTLSLRRATKQTEAHTMKKAISIHALLAESDTIKGKPACAGYLHFYPRSPCGERLCIT